MNFPNYIALLVQERNIRFGSLLAQFLQWCVEHLREFQDYLLAYRLRSLIGGKLRPAKRPLSLTEYAQKRLERQTLARELLSNKDYRVQMKRVDALTDELNFGFWQNPSESVVLLKTVIEQGGCQALESNDLFIEALLSEREQAELSEAEKTLLASYYLGLIKASAAYLDAEIFTRLRAEVDGLREDLPIFIAFGQERFVASEV